MGRNQIILKSKQTPKKKHMLIDYITLLKACEGEREETIHAVWGCQWVKEIWWEDGFCRSRISDCFASFKDLFLGFLKEGDYYF